MTPLQRVTGRALSLTDADVDTDIIYPARFLLITEKHGLGRYAFHDRRGQPGFPLKNPHRPDRPILVAGANFGCGSSREQAPWALADLGLRVIIAPNFGEIFFSNCFRNGLLAITLPSLIVTQLHAVAQANASISVDLETCAITAAALGTIPFTVAADHRELLLNGWDETALIRARHSDDITRFEAAQRHSSPWLWTKDNLNA